MKEVYQITKIETVDSLRVESFFLELDACKKVVDKFLKESTNGEIALSDLISSNDVKSDNHHVIREDNQKLINFTIFRIVHTMQFGIREI